MKMDGFALDSSIGESDVTIPDPSAGRYGVPRHRARAPRLEILILDLDLV